jgi:hypothetical protein
LGGREGTGKGDAWIGREREAAAFWLWNDVKGNGGKFCGEARVWRERKSRLQRLCHLRDN